MFRGDLNVHYPRTHGLWTRVVLFAALLSLPGYAQSAETEPDTAPVTPTQSRFARAAETGSVLGAGAFDVILLRPIGVAATVGGFGCFLILGPLAAASLGIGTVWDALVLGPAEYTFQRPLGAF